MASILIKFHCVAAFYVFKTAEAVVPAGLLAGDEYLVTSCTKPVSGYVGWGLKTELGCSGWSQ